MSNNKVMSLVRIAEQVVELLGDIRSQGFKDAAWDFNQQVAGVCQSGPSRWQRESWCIPDTVVVGDRPVVVLDNKDWINLSKSIHRDHFNKLKDFASIGVTFPVSQTVLEELCDGSSKRQRRSITKTIEALGAGAFTQDPNVLWHHEIESGLTRFVGLDRMSVWPLGRVPFVTDVFGSFGQRTPKLTVSRDGQDVTEAFLQEHPDRADAITEAQQRLPHDLARAILRETPRTGIWSALLDQKLVPQYNKAVESYQGMGENARRLFLRRLASVIVLACVKDFDAFVASCMARGESMSNVLEVDRDSYGNTILNVMPSFDAFVVLSMELIKTGQEVTRNDLQDVRHMAATVPYANIVMTDKRMMTLFESSGLAKKARAKVLYSLDALIDELHSFKFQQHAADPLPKAFM